MTSLKLAVDEVLLAVADRMRTNHAPRWVGRTVLKELAGWSGNTLSGCRTVLLPTDICVTCWL